MRNYYDVCAGDLKSIVRCNTNAKLKVIASHPSSNIEVNGNNMLEWIKYMCLKAQNLDLDYVVKCDKITSITCLQENNKEVWEVLKSLSVVKLTG